MSNKAWTEGEQMSFLNQAILQLTKNGGHIKYNELNMPGRTAKSLSHRMENIRAQAAAYEKQNGQTVASPTGGKKNTAAGPKTPPTSPTRTARKQPSPRGSKLDDDEDDEEYKPGPPAKRPRRSVAKRVKKEVVDSDSDTIVAAKGSDTDKAGVNSGSEFNAEDVKGEDDLDEV
ncbi:hypothetical protein Hte_004829 [Hypoxylon texense]